MSTIEQLISEHYLKEVTFSGLDAQGVDLSGKDFFRCTFRNMKLQETCWERTLLEDCIFEDCDLTGIQPAHMTCRNVQFKRSKLMGIDWSDISLNPQLSFDDCDLRYTSFVCTNLRKTLFHGCKAVEANFFECDLIEADFSKSDLSGANFDASDLREANFATAQGLFLRPEKNKVKNARISVEGAISLARGYELHVVVDGEDTPPKQLVSGRRSRKR